MTQEEYNALIEQIRNAADSVNGEYEKTTDGASTLCDVNQYMEYNPNITVVRNGNGDVIGYDYKYTPPETPNIPALDIDSNNDSGLYAEGGGGYSVGGGAGRNRSSYYAGTINTDEQSTDKANGIDGVVAGYVSPEWAIVSALSKFGKSVTDATSDAITNTADSMSDLLEIIGTRAGKSIRALFGVDDNGNTTMYLDADTIGALAIATRDDGYYDNIPKSVIETTPIDFPTGNPLNGKITKYFFTPYPVTAQYGSTTRTHSVYCMFGYGDYGYIGANVYLCERNQNVSLIPAYACFKRGENDYSVIIASNDSNLLNTVLASMAVMDGALQYVTSNSPAKGSYTYDNKTVYYNSINTSYVRNNLLYEYSNADAFLHADINRVAWYMVYGENWNSEGDAKPGVSTQPGATVPVDAITGADPHVVAENLVNEYPNLMGTPIQVVVMDDSCNQKTINYYSVPIAYSPTNVSVDVPITGTLQLSPSFNPNLELPDINIDNYIDQIGDQLSGSGAGRDNTNTDPETGTPSVLPPIIPGTGSGITPISINPNADVQALWHVYNPLPGELTAFGGWLWSSNVIDQIIRMFVNPMESVIGVHAIYAQPPTGNMQPIVVGTITSTVNSKIVTSQYFTLDCGSVWLTEYFGNVFDYAPYTKVSLFLPFIGIVDLNVADVMRSNISIKYNIDVYTGACIAMVSVIRDGVGGVLYQYPGNCGVEYPISSASYSRMLQSVMAAGATAIGGIASGGAMLPAIGSALGTLAGGSVNVQRSGTFSGNPGAMGPKKPYLIITRPQINMADNFAIYDGIGSNYTSMLKDVTGYIRCKEVHLNVPGAFADELKEIETLLKTGVMITSGSISDGGGSGDITPTTIIEQLTVDTNGIYSATGDVNGYNPVIVNVPENIPRLQAKTVTWNGTVLPDSGYDGLSQVVVNVDAENPPLQEKTITENGTYTPDSGYYGLSSVIVDVAAISGSNIFKGTSTPDNDMGMDGDLYLLYTSLTDTIEHTYTIDIIRALRGSAVLTYAGATEIDLIFDNNGSEVSIKTLNGFTYSATNGNGQSVNPASAFDGNITNYFESNPTPIHINMSAVIPAGYIPKELRVMQRSTGSYTNDVWSKFTLTDSAMNISEIIISESNLTVNDWAGAGNYTIFNCGGAISGNVITAYYIKNNGAWSACSQAEALQNILNNANEGE